MQVLRESPHRRVHQQVSLGRRRGWILQQGWGIVGCPALAEYTLAQPSPSDIMKDLHIPQSVWTFCYETLERNFILLLLPAINLMKCSSLPNGTVNEADIMVGYMLQPIKRLVILLSLIPPIPVISPLKLLMVNLYPPSRSQPCLLALPCPHPPKKKLSVQAQSPLGPLWSRFLRVRGWCGEELEQVTFWGFCLMWPWIASYSGYLLNWGKNEHGVGGGPRGSKGKFSPIHF